MRSVMSPGKGELCATLISLQKGVPLRLVDAAEPTSGLDSTTAMHVLEILRGLATGGRAVLTTIHQARRS